MRRRKSLIVALSALTVALAACTLPRGAALRTEILSQSDIKQADMAIYEVNSALLPIIAGWPPTDDMYKEGWISRRKGPTSKVIASGDRLNLSIWDSNDNSLLTAPEEKRVAMNQVIVQPDGTIFVPYLDKIYVSGLTPEKARESIQKQLEGIIASAQVQLMLDAGRRNSVDLVGGVAKAGNYPLPDRDFTVLGLVSLGGGIPKTMRNPQVRLVRGGKVYATSASLLYAHPAMDTTLRGGDKVIVSQDERYFMALGAAETERMVYFDKDKVSALEAMSMIGGISDSHANPQGILVLREYPDRAVRDDNSGPSKNRTVFTIDLTSADGLFSAGEFPIKPGDVVLVTESAATSVQKVFQLIGTVVGVRNEINK